MDKNLLIGLGFLGAVGIAVYLYFKQQSGASIGGGGGYAGALETPLINQPQKIISEGELKPNVYSVTHNVPTTTVVKRVGSFTHTIQKTVGSTKAGLITVGSPEQQIQQYNVAPRMVKMGGKFYKVM